MAIITAAEIDNADRAAAQALDFMEQAGYDGLTVQEARDVVNSDYADALVWCPTWSGQFDADAVARHTEGTEGRAADDAWDAAQ